MRDILRQLRVLRKRVSLTRSHQVFGILFLILSLSLLVLKIQNVQTLTQRAAVPLPALQATTFTVNVLAIGFNPVEGDRNVADTYFTGRMAGRTAPQTEDYIFNNTIAAFKRLSENTINYNIVYKMNITSFPRYTNGYQFTIDNYKQCVWGTPEFNPTLCDQQKAAFDHNAWLSDNRICELMEEKGADEVWVVSNPYIMRWESFLFGPKDGFFVNAPPVTTATCKKNYILMDATYDAADNFMESYAHRLESIMVYLTNAWGSADRKKYWVDFASWDHRIAGEYSVPTCGNAHWPANATFEYQFNNTAVKTFTCPDWKNFPDHMGETETIGCSVWGCDDKGWQEHWFGALPRGSGTAPMVSSNSIPFNFSKNWWGYILFPENAIAQKKAETTLTTPTPTVTPTLLPSATPTRTPTPLPSPTPTLVPSSIPIPTSTPSVGRTLSLTLLLNAIGYGGDAVSIGAPGNFSPVTPQRSITLQFYDTPSGSPLGTSSALVSFNSSNGNFTGSGSIPSTLVNGSYLVRLQTPRYLRVLAQGFITLDQTNTASTIPLAITTLLVGDSNQDNSLDILDYNILADCYSDLAPPRNCTDSSKKTSADLNDDGKVGGVDINLLIRNAKVRSGG